MFDSLPAPWMRLAVSVALELTLAFAIAMVVVRSLRSAARQRTVWRLAFLAAAALLLVEFVGLGHTAVQSWRPARSIPAAHGPAAIPITIGPAPALDPSLFPAAPAVAPVEALQGETAWADWAPLLVPLAGLLWLALRRLLAAGSFACIGGTPLESGPLPERTRELARRLGIRRRIRLKAIPRLFSPIAFGVFRPVIGVPPEFTGQHSQTQQDSMLAHELAHIAAFDAAWVLAADLITALVWWHPMAWWARRQLRTASELAADEASLLVEDGPTALAECLVALGARMTRTPAFGGLGMAEPRFRSGLGRRVEHLLQLRGPGGLPWRGPFAWMARTLGPVALVGVALGASAWLLPRTAHAATLGEALQRSPLYLATTALLTADENDAPRLILEGRNHYDAGRTNEAEAKWRAAVELDPLNTVARDYLRQIGRTNVPARDGKQFDAVGRTNEAQAKWRAAFELDPFRPTTALATNYTRVAAAREKIVAKLDRIVVGELSFDGRPLSEVVQVLSRHAKDRDPDQKGIAILITSPAVPSESPAPPINLSSGSPGQHHLGDVDLAAIKIRIEAAVPGLSLRQMLDAIVKAAGRPIKYTVEDYGVLFSPRDALELRTRSFRVDPAIFTNSVVRSNAQLRAMDRSRAGLKPAPAAVEPAGNGESRESLFATLVGLPLLESPRGILYNDQLSLLMVRATLPELDRIEQMVQRLNPPPPQVVISVKFCVLPEDQLRGADLFLGVTSTNAAGTPNPRHPTGSAVAGTPTDRRSAVPDAAAAPLTGILTPRQYAVVMNTLEQKPGVEILGIPTVITPTGRQAQLKTVDVKSIVTGLDLGQGQTADPGNGARRELAPISEPYEFGPIIDLIPYVAADARTIQLTIIPSLREFMGYDSTDTWDYVESAGANPDPRRETHRPQPYPLPIFRLRQVVSSATVFDGQTIVLSPPAAIVLPDGHPARKMPAELFDRMAAKYLKKSPRKTLLVFVTPVLVDRAGNAIHSDIDLPERTLAVPPQVPQR